jgi:hypothetical protein
MIFVETSVFTRRVIELLTDDEYRKLQGILSGHPDAGKVIPSSGGIRKIRWAAQGQGKRGGVRVIYYWFVDKDRILMLYLYPKKERGDLTPVQLRALRDIVEEDAS